MNILEQEDLIKGLPDQVLFEEAQAPTGNVPQYLVVSEIHRRKKMREKFNEQVPQNTVTDQIISGGIAAMNPNPDPLMGAAMGAPPPMTGQDLMMQPPMQDPMMGQMQDPVMGQMPEDIAMGQQMPQDPMMQMQDPMMQDPMMQDPMMQQGIMAAGGGMMPYRVEEGRKAPNITPRDHISSHFELLEMGQMSNRDAISEAMKQLRKAESSEELEELRSFIEHKAATSEGMPEDLGKRLYNYTFPRQDKEAAGFSAKPFVYSTALREDVSRGLLADPELARMIGASEAGSVKVNPKAAVREEAKAEQLDALNVLEEMGSARADGGMMPYRMYDGRRIPDIKRIMAQLGISEDLLRQSTPEQRAVYEEAMNKAIERERAAGIADLDPYEGSDYRKGSPLLQDLYSPAKKRDIADEKAALGDRGYLKGSDIGRTFNENVLAAEQARDRKPFAPGALEDYSQYKNIEISEPEFKNIFAQFAIEDAEAAEQARVAALTGGGAGGQGSGLAAPGMPEFGTVDLSGLKGVLGKKLDYLGHKVNFKGLLEKEEARSKLAAEQARKDAASNALIQLGAGIAGGDMAGGISKAGEAAMLSRREAREEEKGLTTLQRQIELADRQQQSTLGIKALEAQNERDIALQNLAVKGAENALNRDEKLYNAVLQRSELLLKVQEAGDNKVKSEAMARYYDASAESATALANSREFAAQFPDHLVDEELKTLIANDPVIARELMSMSKPAQRAWYLRRMAGDAINQFSPGMASPSASTAGYVSHGMVNQ